MHAPHLPRPRLRLLAAAAAGLLSAHASAQTSDLPSAHDSAQASGLSTSDWERDPRVRDAAEIRAQLDVGLGARVVVTLKPTNEIASFSNRLDLERVAERTQVPERAAESPEHAAELTERVAEHRARAEGHRARVSDHVLDVLARVVSPDMTIGSQLENTPIFMCTVGEEGLQKLLQEPRVRAVQPDAVVTFHTKQGIPQIGVTSEIRTAYDGSGVSIAILDSGINYVHEALGRSDYENGSYVFPNEKVIGGYNPSGWTDPVWGSLVNGVFDFNGHGSSVAAIAAGDVIEGRGDYDGGVAPGARLYALSVTGSDGQAYESNTLLCLDWCVTHQYDSPENPILVVNYSAGVLRYYSDFCDLSEPAWDQTMDTLHDAGIALFASSGNDAYCTQVPVPACMSQTITVGATYDLTYPFLEPETWCVAPDGCDAQAAEGCSTDTICLDPWPRAGQMACFSNKSANPAVLDLVAPSHIARTANKVNGNWNRNTYHDFSGTSASAPYAAGAAAILQSYTRSWGHTMGVEELRYAMVTFGNPTPNGWISDAPQVDVEASIAGMTFDRPVVWVDAGHSGPQLGTQAAPFTSILTAINQVAWGGQVWVRGGQYSIPAAQSKAMSFHGYDGLVSVGP